jgi:LysM repeat protein
MTAIRILTPSLLAIALVACSSQKASEYDTQTTRRAPAVAQATPPAPTATNPVYDTPAAYEEGASAPAVSPPAAAPAATSPAPAAASNGAAIIHTVVKGDTLSGISKKYKVPVASIKQANRMTNDTVVLDRKMVIPPQ